MSVRAYTPQLAPVHLRQHALCAALNFKMIKCDVRAVEMSLRHLSMKIPVGHTRSSRGKLCLPRHWLVSLIEFPLIVASLLRDNISDFDIAHGHSSVCVCEKRALQKNRAFECSRSDALDIVDKKRMNLIFSPEKARHAEPRCYHP